MFLFWQTEKLLSFVILIMDSTFLFINSAKYGGNGLYLVLLLIKIRNIIKKLAGNGVEDIQKKKYPEQNVTSEW